MTKIKIFLFFILCLSLPIHADNHTIIAYDESPIASRKKSPLEDWVNVELKLGKQRITLQMPEMPLSEFTSSTQEQHPTCFLLTAEDGDYDSLEAEGLSYTLSGCCNGFQGLDTNEKLLATQDELIDYCREFQIAILDMKIYKKHGNHYFHAVLSKENEEKKGTTWFGKYTYLIHSDYILRFGTEFFNTNAKDDKHTPFVESLSPQF